MESNNSPHLKDVEVKSIALPSRRKFLRYAGVAGAVGLVAGSCQKSLGPILQEAGDLLQPIDLGSGDIGILNYAYALEQLEAAFYTIVIFTPYNNISSSEMSLLTDVRDHEIAHREFFKNALGSKAIPTLAPNFTSVNFASRESVLSTAKTFEDTGVSAYNGAGSLIVDPDYLLIAGKIVSVEARHAAYIRDLLSFGSFADSTVVNSNGLDTSRKPAQVLQLVAPFIVQKLDGSHLPTA